MKYIVGIILILLLVNEVGRAAWNLADEMPLWWNGEGSDEDGKEN